MIYNSKKYLQSTVLITLMALTPSSMAILDNGMTYSPDGESILFHSYRDKAGELWLMDKNGKNKRKITEGNNHDRWPQYSSDGKKIVFISRRDGDWEVFSANSDGSDIKQITNNDVSDLGGTFSPSGNKIVVATVRKEGPFMADLVMMNSDGTHPIKIVENGLWPNWSRDGSTIIYGHATGENKFDIWAYNVANKTTKALTSDNGKNFGGTPSADGKSVTFVSNRSGEFMVYKMNIDGTKQVPLGIAAKMDSKPSLSPDNKQLIWANNKFGGDDIFSQTLATGEHNNLTPNSSFDRYPDISPNGEILITSKKDGNSELYLLDNRGKSSRLTKNDSNDESGKWSPNGKDIAFASNRNGGVSNIFIMNSKGKNIRQITHFKTDAQLSAWSSDGLSLYVMLGTWDNQRIIKVDIRTEKQQQLLHSDASTMEPTFSADGKYVVYAKGQGRDYDLIKRDLNNDSEITLVDTDGWDFSPNFSPDGKHIAFASNRDGELEIFVMDSNGDHIRQLTDNYRRDINPQWAPDGQTLVFDSNRYGNFEPFSIGFDGKALKRLTK